MLKKTLIASATAGLIAVGTMAATTGTASAGNGNYNFYVGNGHLGFSYQTHKPRKVCKPVFRKIRVWDYYGRSYWKRVKVGVNCHRVKKHRKRQHNVYRPHRQQHWNHGHGWSFRYGW